MSDSPELLKPNLEVTDRRDEKIDKLEATQPKNQRLQNDLGNLQAEIIELRSQLETMQAENQRLQTELGNSEGEREELNQELTELRSQFETERADRQEVEKRDRAAILAQRSQIKDLKRGYGLDSTPTENILRRQLADLQTELSELKQNLASTATLSEKLIPDAPTILSQLRAKRKKSKTDLADLEAILEILENSAEKIEEGG